MIEGSRAANGASAARLHFAFLALALMMAGCAGGPPVTQHAPPPGAAGEGFSLYDGADIAYPEFQNSAFPYRGLIPEEDRPFLNVNENGRLGHSSARAGVYWEDQTYDDRHVLIAAAPDFDSRGGGVLVLFFHGNNATLARDVVARQQAPRQFVQSGLRGVLVAPQMAYDASDSSAGAFWRPGGLARFLDEADARLAGFYPGVSPSTFARMPVVIVAYSGGYLPAAYALAVGGAQGRVHGVVLLDALYGQEDKFFDWILRARGRGFFVSAYSQSSRAGNEALRARLQEAGVPVENGSPQRIGPGLVAFIDAGDVSHEDFVSAAWTSDPLRDVLARIGR